METINDWYIIENKMSKGVMYFHVTITINSDFEIILEITNGNKDNLTLKFNTVEDAVHFTQKYVSKSFSVVELENIYNKLYLGKVKEKLK